MSNKYQSGYTVPKELDEKVLKKAKKELNEKDSKQVIADIEYIKEWLSKQSHIKSRMDDAFILAFLRYSKFSYSRAQEALTNFWTNRVEMNDVFQGRNFNDDSIMMELSDIGTYSWLPHLDDDGCRVCLNRISLWDPKKYSFDDLNKYYACTLDAICEDPRVQINGIVLVLDMTGLSSSHATEMSPARAQKMMKIFQRTYPVRIKAIHYYNYPKLFDIVFPIIKQFMSEKIKSRLNFHGDDLKSLHKKVPKAILPKELGGELESMNVINENFVNYLKANEKLLLDYQNYGIDLEKAKVHKKNYASSNDATEAVTGTFRKLNVD